MSADQELAATGASGVIPLIGGVIALAVGGVITLFMAIARRAAR